MKREGMDVRERWAAILAYLSQMCTESCMDELRDGLNCCLIALSSFERIVKVLKIDNFLESSKP